MPHFRHSRFLEEDAARQLLIPRNDALLQEKAIDDSNFSLAKGPFVFYERSVEVAPSPSGIYVTETFTYKIASPVWRLLLGFPIRRFLKRGGAPEENLWWAPPEIFDSDTARTLSLLCIAAVITGYLGALLGQTATFAAEEFGASDRAQGVLLALVRIGTLITVLVAGLADKHGRKRLLIFSLWSGCLMTLLSAASPNIALLGISQAAARGFATAISILIGIMAAEAAPKGSRAYIAGILTLTAGLGAGIPVWLLSLADIHAKGWRLLFLISFAFFPVIAWLKGQLNESERFHSHQETHSSDEPGSLAPVVWSRFLALAAVAFLILMFAAPASQFRNEFLRDERGFSAAQISLFILASHTPQIIGVAIAAKVSDLRGRKPVAAFAVGVGSLFTVLAYSFSGVGMWFTAMIAGIISAGAGPSLGVYGAEMFSTGRRGQSNGAISIFAVLGSACGLLLIGDFSERFGSFGKAFSLLSICPILVVILVLVFFPESRNRELEDLNPEDLPSNRR
ncbi:MAG: hypothetical protein CL463_04625 [Acidimicrobiaceae bacterium]|nr:hypothetical protein [Acidimicrobiaceae bacterium]|tara:strand:- start:3702 stop:5231 length:1530 start_codon:yes stop_codon:yes gene_type:complete